MVTLSDSTLRGLTKPALIKTIKELYAENEHFKKALNQIHYCPYDDKCGELYDCTKEEYQGMTESNMKLYLKNDELQQRINKAMEYIEQNKYVIREYTSANSGTKKIYELCCEPDDLLNILQGNDGKR